MAHMHTHLLWTIQESALLTAEEDMLHLCVSWQSHVCAAGWQATRIGASCCWLA